MALLLWRAAQTTSKWYLVVICATLAIGYIAAFHAVGVLFFSGLLRDFDGLSRGYLGSMLAVVGVLFVLFTAASMTMFWIQNVGRKKQKEPCGVGEQK